MKTFNKTILTGAMLAAASVACAEDPFSFSANVAITNDYMFRGISQSDNDPAVSGGFDLGLDNGIYVGTWASNVELADAVGNISNIEMDFYAGLAGEMDSGLGWDIGGLYFYYPDSTTPDLDFWEAHIGLSYTLKGMTFEPTLGVTVYYSPDFFFESDNALYVDGSIDLALPQGFTLSGHVGHQDIKDNATFGTPDYTDWSVTLGKSFVGLDFAISYVDTDLSTAECFAGTDYCDGRGIFTVSKSF